MDIATFRTDFPEFANETTYPDTLVQRNISLAEKFIVSTRWDDAELREQGLGFATAHFLVLSSKALSGAGTSSLGAVAGTVSSKSVGKASVSYDIQSITLADGGAWNTTVYGVQFLQFARFVGTGGLQV